VSEQLPESPGTRPPTCQANRFQLIDLGQLALVVNGRQVLGERFVIVDNDMGTLAQDPDLAVPGFYSTRGEALQAITKIRASRECGGVHARVATVNALRVGFEVSSKAPVVERDAALTQALAREAILNYIAVGNLATAAH
jgi:hypothetical protein